MARFCTICGNKLEDTEICSCQQKQQPVEQFVKPNEGLQPSGQAFQPNQGQQPLGEVPQMNQRQQPLGQAPQMNEGQAAAPNNAGIYFNRLWHVASQTIKTPSNMLKQYTEASDAQVAFGFIGAQAIAIALLLVALFGKLNSFFNSGLTDFLEIYFRTSIEFPLGKIFIITLILSVLLSMAFAGILFFFTKVVFKGETDFMKMVCVVGAKSLAIVPFTLIAFLIGFFSISASIVIYTIGLILGYFYATEALKGAVTVDENKSVYILFLSFATMVIVNGIAIKSAIPSILPDISSILKAFS